MSVTAKQLSKSGARGKDIDSLVHEQLALIDDHLLRADRTWGRNVVAHELPTGLTQGGLEKKDAQRVIYSSILRSLETRGFEVRILLEDARTMLYIAWMTDLSTTEVEAMNALIRSRRIEPADLESFVRQGALPAPRSMVAARQGRAAPARPMTVAEERVMLPRGGAAASEAAARRTNPAPARLSSAEGAILAGE